MHTATPWDIHETAKHIYIVGPVEESERAHRVVALVFGADQAARDNARLLKAAPRMFDWLKRVAPSWDDEARAIVAEIDGE